MTKYGEICGTSANEAASGASWQDERLKLILS